MKVEKLEAVSVKFFEKVLETIHEALPFDNESDVSVEVDSMADKGTVASTITAPLKHPETDSSDIPAGYSDLFKIAIEYVMCADRSGTHLTVHKSKFELQVHTAPGIRFEYERDKHNAPSAHIHYFGIAGIISPALMRNFSGTKKKQKKGQLNDVHLPVGGHRFRPSLEEFLYFIIKECGFQGRNGWENKLLDKREDWLDMQCAAATRDAPNVAADTLRKLGYKVTAPDQSVANSCRHSGW